MTLARLSERLQEEKEKKGKVDGRRFNSRSKTKMYWEIRKIKRAMKNSRNAKKAIGLGRNVFTIEELKEYKKMNQESMAAPSDNLSESKCKDKSKTKNGS